MVKSKNFLVLCVFSLLCSVIGTKEARAHTLTLKPKFQCEEGKLLIQGTCIDSNSSDITSDEDNDGSTGRIAFSTKFHFRPLLNSHRIAGVRGIYADKRNRFKKWV